MWNLVIQKRAGSKPWEVKIISVALKDGTCCIWSWILINQHGQTGNTEAECQPDLQRETRWTSRMTSDNNDEVYKLTKYRSCTQTQNYGHITTRQVTIEEN